MEFGGHEFGKHNTNILTASSLRSVMCAPRSHHSRQTRHADTLPSPPRTITTYVVLCPVLPNNSIRLILQALSPLVCNALHGYD